MRIKTKKKVERGIARLETLGEIKEILIKEDFLDTSKTRVDVCFRGHNSSGIIEFSPREIEMLHKEVSSKMKLVGKVKVMKFGK